MSSLTSPITTAVIAVAGFGTRRLPITKTLEKCLMPLGNRPIVDYIVEDCLRAGITDIIFVVGEQSNQIRTYYGTNPQLETYLEAGGKTKALQMVRDISTKARFHYVVQDADQPYGTSTPVWLSRDLLKPDERFVFLYGDNVFYNEDGSSTITDFITEANNTGTKAAMLAVPVPDDMVSHYGIVALENRDGLDLYQKIVEKPKPEDAPTNLNNAGCFLLSTNIMPYVERSIVDSPQPEKYFIDALNWYVADGNDTLVVRMQGEWLDCGSVHGWLHANNRIVKPK